MLRAKGPPIPVFPSLSPQAGDIATSDRPRFDLAWVQENEADDIMETSALLHNRVLRLWKQAPSRAAAYHRGGLCQSAAIVQSHAPFAPRRDLRCCGFARLLNARSADGAGVRAPVDWGNSVEDPQTPHRGQTCRACVHVGIVSFRESVHASI